MVSKSEAAFNAKKSGDSAEIIVEAYLAQCKQVGVAWGFKNYPEVRGAHGEPFVVGKGQPDYTICLDGQLVLIELKSFSSAVNKKTMPLVVIRRRGERTRVDTTCLHEWENLRTCAEFNGRAYYLIRWKNDEWRLYNTNMVEYHPQNETITFDRERGHKCHMNDHGLPNFIRPILAGA